MENSSELKGLIVSQKLTQKQVYERMGLTRRKWNTRLETGKWSSDEMYKLQEILGDKVISIFFKQKVT